MSFDCNTLPQCGQAMRVKKAMCYNSAQFHTEEDPEGKMCAQNAEHECYAACQTAQGKPDDWIPYMARKVMVATADAKRDPMVFLAKVVVVGAAVAGGVWLFKKYKRTN